MWWDVLIYAISCMDFLLNILHHIFMLSYILCQSSICLLKLDAYIWVSIVLLFGLGFDLVLRMYLNKVEKVDYKSRTNNDNNLIEFKTYRQINFSVFGNMVSQSYLTFYTLSPWFLEALIPIGSFYIFRSFYTYW